LVAFMGQSLADSLIGVPSVMLPLIILAAICTYNTEGGWLAQSRLFRPQLGLWLTVIIAGWVGWSLVGLARFENLLADMDQRQWAAASARLDQLPRLALPLALLRFQQGLTHGQLALENPSGPELTEAIARYEEGLALTPAYLPGHANLAALYWQAGDTGAAQAALQTAIDLIGPRDPGTLYLLNLGLLQEQTGAEQAAIDSYALAIAQRPALAGATFWQDNVWRQQHWPTILRRGRRLLEQTTSGPARPLELGKLAFYSGDIDRAEAYFLEAGGASRGSEADIWRGKTLIQRGDGEAALLLFDQIIGSAAGRAPAEVYLQRGHIYLELGQPQAAERDLRMALFLGHRSSHFYLGQLALQHDDVEQAIARFRQGLPATFDIQVLYRNYDFMFFRANYWQWRVDGNLLPLKAFPPSVSEIERYVALADLYEQMGDLKAARNTYSDLLWISPNLDLAKEKLADLEN
ncbi:MAG: tetratricopeptide repeat protein, partial [Anaerolineae bacterium]|nr:tetratricopeptide repeat protein [Anaerolineae bacterium]